MTLNDLERRNDRYFVCYLTEFGSFEANYVRQSGWRYVIQRTCVYGNTWLMVLFSKSTEKERVRERYRPPESDNSTCAALRAAISATAGLLLRYPLALVDQLAAIFVATSDSAHLFRLIKSFTTFVCCAEPFELPQQRTDRVSTVTLCRPWPSILPQRPWNFYYSDSVNYTCTVFEIVWL